jgi:hypothetical protein
MAIERLATDILILGSGGAGACGSAAHFELRSGLG